LIGLVTLVFVPRAGSSPRAHYQSTAVLQGRVLDQNGAVAPRAQITAKNSATALAHTGEADSEGNYQFAALPVGNYRMEVRAAGFRTEIVEHLNIEVARIVVQDFRLEVGDITQTINVAQDASQRSTLPIISTGPATSGRINDVDFSVLKNIALGENTHLQFRTEVPDSFNHANFEQPGRVVSSATFGQIINTRFPTSDSGSSRQLQFALKFLF
jgi:hypothetical protein